MKSPYEILGITPDADTDRLREAYRDLAQKYEGDARRMQEINDAYDAIVLSRGGGYSQQSAYRTTGSSRGSAGDTSDIWRQIQSGRFDDAITLLDGIPQARRDAYWYYLKGCAQRGRGWLEEARINFAQAARLDPNNREYRAAYEQMREQPRNQQNEEALGCLKLCGGLMCLNCLCDCCH